MRTRIKVCGLTRLVDAEAAAKSGVDALGLIFFDASSRAVNLSVAAEIAGAAQCFVDVVGVFVNPTRREVEDVLNKVPLTCLQFHGEEESIECERFGLPYIKTVRMQDGVDPMDVARTHPAARAILLDSYHPGKYGGTGESFSWARAKYSGNRPIILAGGITKSNVSQALTITSAYGVDVSTGVETVPGIKDYGKIVAFIRAVADHDRTVHSTPRNGGNPG